MPKIIFSLVLLLTSAFNLASQDVPEKSDRKGENWVDSVYNSLSQEEKIAQLIMVPAWSEKGPEHEKDLDSLVRNHKIGGIAFFQGGPNRQIKIINHLQSVSNVPIIMGIDAEWGLGMRLDSTMRFPYQIALGAIQNDKLIYQMGREIGRQLRSVGIQMNFAPVVDVNNNSANPVINYRSFGSDQNQVAKKGIAYMNGLQDERIIPTAKHFPGHGDTRTDSHLALPVIRHDLERLNAVELYPFKQLINSGLEGIMVAHLNIPALDPETNIPTTLSAPVLKGNLRKELGFNGLIVTDALNMKGVADQFPPGEVEVRALMAGNDMLVYVQDVRIAVEAIKKAIQEGRIPEEELEEHCKRVLFAKYWTGLANVKKIETFNNDQQLFPASAQVLRRELTRASLTALRNENNIIPVRNLESTRIASVCLGRDRLSSFQSRLKRYTRIDDYSIDRDAANSEFDSLMVSLKDYDLVILGIHNMDMRASKNFGLTLNEASFIQRIVNRQNAVISLFGNPYALGIIPEIEKASGLIVAYYDNFLAQDFAAQLVFGGIGADGRLPVDVNSVFKAGDGLNIEGGIRFSYVLPEEVGIDHSFLKKKIDSICQLGLDSAAYPGCQVLAARDGKVFFHECYGFHTYDNKQPVQSTDIFDLASVTKVSGPLPPLIRLYDERKILLDEAFSNYWPKFRGTNKESFSVREGLAHYARLAAWIPYYKEAALKEGPFSRGDLKTDSSRRFSGRVSEDLWIKKKYKETIYNAIEKSPLLKKKEYVYSGLLSYIYPELIENITGRDYEEYLYNEFYRPLGAWTLVYNPLRWYPSERIVPTENDDFFRMEQLRGYVHDEGAAMMGGVSGNAGLFSTAEDLAKLHQMYLWGGQYGGRQFLSRDAMDEFTRCQYCEDDNRRGLGFDKPSVGNDTLKVSEAYPAHSVSSSSFGHSGYTGTFVWADPDSGILYVFFSNRVFPTRENSKLYDLNIRSAILETFYNAIENKNCGHYD